MVLSCGIFGTDRLDAYDRGISDEWVKLSVYEDIFESKDYYVVR